MLLSGCQARSGRWYVSLTVEVERLDDAKAVQGDVSGIDLGGLAFATLSDGTEMEAAKPRRSRLKRLQKKKAHSRKKSSNRRRKSAIALARFAKAGAQPAWISVIVVEDLDVKNLMRNRHLSRTISDTGWRECHRQLSYKTEWCGSILLTAGRFHPSSKMGSECGAVKEELDLTERVFTCDACGLVLGRDLNAARNLAALARAS